MRNKFFLIFFFTISFAKVSIRIESNPHSAHVKIDGEPFGLTPIESISLSPGPYKIELTLEEFAPIHYSFDLQTAGFAVLRFQLNRIYTVTFNTQEKGLNYELDDQYNWIEEKINLKMEEGIHNLKVFDGDSLVDEKEIWINKPSKIFYELISN